jgi:hypothetical protein
MIYLFSFILVLGSVWTNSVKAADSDPVGWWKFDEGSGTIAADSSGHGMNGTLVQDPAWRQNGVYGGCLFFDGAQSYVRVTHQDSLNPGSGSFTFTFWAYVEATPGASGDTTWDLPVAKRDSGSIGYYIGASRNQGNADQTGYRFMLGDTSANRKDTPFLTVPLEEWVFVAAVLDRDQNTQSFSVDGGQTWATTTPPPGPIEPAQDLGIGWDIGQNNYWFHGMVDDVRIYDWPLSAREIQIVMGGGQGFPLARRPVPDDGTMLENTWVNLSWEPGSYSVSHDVYLGDKFEDVNNGIGDTFRGNHALPDLIAGISGYPYPDGLVPGTTYYWRVDEVNDANTASPWKGDIWSFTVTSKTAYHPFPPDGAEFVETDVVLNWTAGLDARLHTVYFGDNLEDVINATGGSARPGTTYTPGPLELDQTYYWRVDEFDSVNTHKGNVWSFRTLPDIPISDPDLVGWWKLDEGYGTKALDWSGHNNHAILVDGPQWVDGYMDGALEFNGSNYATMDAVADDITDNDITLSGWVKTTDSHGLWLSCNTGSRGNVALWSIDNRKASMYDGSDSTYEGYSSTIVSDGKWHMLTYVRRGSTGYIYVDGSLENTHEAGYSFSATDLWSIAQEWDAGGPTDFLIGIVDDVRIYDTALTQDQIMQLMRGDPLLAWNPSPAHESNPSIGDALPLSWSAGDNVVQHDVYFGTDKKPVKQADASDVAGIYRGRQNTNTYSPPEGIEWGGGPYYWRIDEYNADGTINKGRVWSFTVADFIGVDDFENYDAGDNQIWYVWKDGLGYGAPGTDPYYPGNGTGAAVGDETTSSYMEETIVHGGGKSMPVSYDNNKQGYMKYSEVEHTLTVHRDWTEQGVAELSLWFYGYAANAAEPFYVAVTNIEGAPAIVVHDDPAAATTEKWTEWIIPLQAFADQGIDLTNVTSIAIGLGTRDNTTIAGGSGKIYFDDMRLYRLRETAE